MDDTDVRFLDALYGGVTEISELKRALELVQKRFDCRAAALVSLDVQAPAMDVALTSGLFDQYGRLYLEQFAKIDPAPAVFTRIPAGTASTTDRLLSHEQRHNDAFVNEFFRPIGLTETLGGHLFSDHARFSLIGLQRGDDRAPFDDDDIAKFERLVPHVTRALQLRRAFFRVERSSLALQAAVDQLPAGVVLLDAGGGVVFVNAAMRTMARRADGLSLDRMGRPLPANLAARQRLGALLNDVANGGAGGTLAVPRASGARDYVMLVAPSPPAFTDLMWQRRGAADAIILIHDPTSRPRATPEVLAQALHLPPAAARLVAALATDDDLKSFAEREGITIHTVRFHLRTALARTGARTQAELVRLVVRLLRDLALSDHHN